MKAQKWIVEREFLGEPTSENLKLVDFEIPDDLCDGGNLAVQEHIIKYYFYSFKGI